MNTATEKDRSNPPALKTQADAVRYFFEQMDEEMLDLILPEELTYQDKTKEVFMSMVTQAFEVMRRDGDRHLLSVKATCTGCQAGHTIYHYIGEKGKKFISILFEEKNGLITDNYECNQFEIETRFPGTTKIILDDFDPNAEDTEFPF